ncbi:MAG TPA: ATP-dependent DNA helicase RecG [Solirubrobacteraceae bacterium]|nr:ATP-dependent DNA helicase RecG [Solirubrobacteraceae bacterium]
MAVEQASRLGFAGVEVADPSALLEAVRWLRPSRLERPLALKGKVGEAAASLGLETFGDLLEHVPRSRREGRTVAALSAGETATVVVEVRTITQRPVRRRGMRPIVEATVADESGPMVATFFNQPWLARRYVPGTRLVLHGKYEGRSRFRVAAHARTDESGSGEEGVSHYAATEGISSTQILALMREARDLLGDVVEPLPGRIRASERLPARGTALEAMHFAAAEADVELGRRRLAFEELLLLQLALLQRRARRSGDSHALALACARDGGEQASLSARWLEGGLPFELTGDQRAAIELIGQELESIRPVQRLLMGEVGSGKTVVALFAMLRAVECGSQAALMAPTETLAEQHFATIQALLGSEPVTLALLTGSTPAARRAQILERLQSGELSLIVGTHALIEDPVRFRSLALAVVDEQHRFGVRQRAALDAKARAGFAPHVLHMTATPIPRTLALCRYGDLDQTRLSELPARRQPIETHVVAGAPARSRAYERIAEELRAGRQAFVVCPLVEQPDELDGGDVRAATVEFERLRAGELRDFRVVLMHGQLSHREKQAAMSAFAAGDADVLVATTVIEVGIDVPNATVMLIENAERFGISQLHQLRGRVGRGEHAAICLLCGPKDSLRLNALARHSDGFELAEIDLYQRKEGELIGTRQSGLGQFAMARLPEDEALLSRARYWAEGLLSADPELEDPANVLLARALSESHGEIALRPIAA